jgi:ABC-type transport system substrate-binding protein
LYKKYLVEGVEFYTHHLGFNLETPGAPWADVRVRQAVNYAIDRRAIVDVVRHGLAYVATGALPQMLQNPGTAEGYEYNPERAKQLLAEAGYPKGFSVRILSYDSPGPLAVSEAVLGYLEAIGIRARLEVVDSTAARVRREQGRFEWFYGSLGGEGHPLIFLRRGFHTAYIGAAGNWTRYRNPRIDELLDRAAEARDPGAMVRLIRTAESIIVNDAPWVFLTFNKAVVVQQPYLRGLRATPIDLDWQPLEEVWLAWTPKRR